MNYKNGLKKIFENTTVDSGVFGTVSDIGTHGGSVGNVDFYAPGDARNVFGLDVDKKDSKKKKKKKKKKFPLYRRAFMESNEDDELTLECVLFCRDEYRELAEKLAEKYEFDITEKDDVFIISGLDERIQHYIGKMSAIVGESVFSENYLVFICEMNNYQDLLKRPKLEDEDYNQEQLRNGTEIEMEHTDDISFARIIAKHHLDEDEFYYDKLRKIERLPKIPDQPK